MLTQFMKAFAAVLVVSATPLQASAQWLKVLRDHVVEHFTGGEHPGRALAGEMTKKSLEVLEKWQRQNPGAKPEDCPCFPKRVMIGGPEAPIWPTR
jgi:hypothetical protein